MMMVWNDLDPEVNPNENGRDRYQIRDDFLEEHRRRQQQRGS